MTHVFGAAGIASFLSSPVTTTILLAVIAFQLYGRWRDQRQFRKIEKDLLDRLMSRDFHDLSAVRRTYSPRVPPEMKVYSQDEMSPEELEARAKELNISVAELERQLSSTVDVMGVI